MLSIITGLPGNGKTLYALQYVAAWAKREGRQVWYHGIKGLKPELGWQAIPTTKEKIGGNDVEVPNWWLLPTGSIFLIDEAQMCGFGSRPRGTSPVWSQKLETHRHLGLDGVFITQDPKLLDSHDRALCELHFHVMRTFGMQRATIHEFRPVRDNIKSRTGSIQHKWKFPKEIFEWYVSAEAHTHKKRIPTKVYVLIGIVLLLPVIAGFVWWKYLDPGRYERAKAAAAPANAASAVSSGGVSGGKGGMSRDEYLRANVPRVAGLAFTAPVYDDVTKVQDAPYPAACVLMGKRCGCYTQQGTKLETPKGLCESIVDGGFFVAWQAREQPKPVMDKNQDERPRPKFAEDQQSVSMVGIGPRSAQPSGMAVVPEVVPPRQVVRAPPK